MSAESQRIADGGAYLRFYSLRRIVQIQLLIPHPVSYRRMDPILHHTLHTYDTFYRTRGAQHMSRHRLGRIDMKFIRMFTKGALDRDRLKEIIMVSTRAMGVHIINVFWF